MVGQFESVSTYSDMLNRILREKDLALSPVARQAGLERGLDNVIEQECSVDEECKADNLEPLEGLPAQAERDKPDEEGTAGVDCAAGGGRDGVSNR
jgi:hypothetical protein